MGPQIQGPSPRTHSAVYCFVIYIASLNVFVSLSTGIMRLKELTELVISFRKSSFPQQWLKVVYRGRILKFADSTSCKGA
jgi:hypothetical protein